MLDKGSLAVFGSLIALTMGIAPAAVRAQTAPSTDAVSLNAPKRVAALRVAQIPAWQVIDKIARSSGAAVATDSTIAGGLVSFSTSGGPVDVVLPQLVALLPKGAALRAVLVPAYLPMPDGDAIAAFVKAQDALKTSRKPEAGSGPAAVSVAAPSGVDAVPRFVPGEWEVMGRRFTADKASAIAATLDLKPVYLITLTRPAEDPVAKASTLQMESLRLWQSMTPQQRASAMDQQINGLFNMDSNDRQTLLGQMMGQGMIAMQKINAMPPEQRAAFQQEVMNAMKANGFPLPGAPGAGAGKP